MWLAAKYAGAELTAGVCVSNPILAEEMKAIRRLESQGIHIQYFPISKSFVQIAGRWALSLPLVMWILRVAPDYDIIQVHGSWLFSTLAASIVAKVVRRPLLSIPHESLTEFDMRKEAGIPKRSVKRMFKSWLLYAADQIVFSSHLEQNDSVGKTHAGKCAVIYHPVFEDENFRPRQRQWVESIGVLTVGFLGRFDRKKNLELLLEAVGKIPEVVLKIAGDGTSVYRKRLDDMVQRLGIASRVEWLGFVLGKDRGKFFESIDVLVMPSEYECFGRAAAEAMVFGIPTVVAKLTGMAELVTRHSCGIVIEPDVESIRKAIVKLRMDGDMLRDFSRRAVAAGKAELSIGSYSRSILKIYGKMKGREMAG